MDVQVVGGERAEATVDSGAEESVLLWGWVEQFKVQPREHLLRFRNASGGEMKHYRWTAVLVMSPFHGGEARGRESRSNARQT